MTTPRFPVKPIGRILNSERHDHRWDPKAFDGRGSYRYEGFKEVCACKGFSDDRPFAVWKYERELFSNEKPTEKMKDPKPFKVVFHWTNRKDPKRIKVRYGGEEREEYDYDTFTMMDVLEEHATKNAAQIAMRRFATEAFAKVNKHKPQEQGSACNCKGIDDCELRLGDLVEWTSNPGIVWRILSERRTTHDWSLKVEPAFSFLVNDGTDKVKEVSQRDASWYVKPIGIVQLNDLHAALGLFIAGK